MSHVSVTPIPLLKDNYAYVIHESESGMTAVVDPSEAMPVIRYCKENRLKLDYVLNTHHHWDHTGGNVDLKNEYGCKVVGFSADAERIPGIDLTVDEGGTFIFGETSMNIIYIPGHTLGHVAYHFPKEGLVFTGDTLFSLGCGRLFEGTPEQMWNSLKKLRDLPPETLVYCGHEYTEHNCLFALSLEPENEGLHAFNSEILRMRAEGEYTVPSAIGTETRLNPFLRADDPDLARALDLSASDPISVFSEIRSRKDTF